MTNKIGNQLRGLAIYQTIGGSLGIAFTVVVMLQGDTILTQQVLRASLLAAALFVFSIICGSQLFRNPQRGLRLSLVNQVLQVVYFAFGAYGFQYVAGLRVGFGFDMVGSWTFKFRLALSSFQFDFGTDTGQKFIGINLLALFLIFWIESLQDKVKPKV
ncbi:hypothetical protein [Pontibacter pamirensis]|uniref:hypothetical protein n=1 Tax=Pontibacter pamirensis TaxID=2562824 RepID=UPI001389C968|nr:hypothetical protein [Pontibacter pamirensis]